MEIVVGTSSEGQTLTPVQSNHRLKTDIAWKYITEAQDEAGKKLVVCNFCQKSLRGGGINRMKQHLAGVKGDVASCVKVPDDVKLLMQGILEGKSQKTKEKPRGLHGPKLSCNKEVEVQTIRPQTTLTKAGNGKAPLKMPLNFKRVVDGDGDDDEALPPGIRVAKFDHSVENHLKSIDKIAMISGESEFEYEPTEIQRLSASVTFLSEWRYFCYQPRAIRFACEKETSHEKDVTTKINLPQFSSAVVRKDVSLGDESSSPLSKDFVMYVGGSVWALDWCPKVHQNPNFDTNVEFIAVSAHPPESSYHKVGAPVTGRGLIQIWCVLTTGQSQGHTALVKVKKRKPYTNIDPTKPKKQQGRPRKYPKKEMNNMDQIMEDVPNNLLQLVSREEIDEKLKSCKPKKPRGRPRKKPVRDSSNDVDGNNKNMQSVIEVTNDSPKTSPEPLAVKFPDNFTPLTPGLLAKEQVTKKVTNVYTRRRKSYGKDQSRKSIRASSKSKSTDGQTRRESQVEGVHHDDVMPRLVMGLAHIDKSTKSIQASSKSKSTDVQTRSESQAKGVDDPPVLPQKCKSRIDQVDVMPRLVMGLAHIDTSAKLKRVSSVSKSAECHARSENQVKGVDPPILSENSECQVKCVDQDDVMPRLVMGLAHMGKVAWDVKWRPSDSRHISKYIMGFLAVLLGNGALEVWEVPLPHVTKTIYSTCKKEGNDPRFLKLKPVFLCSMLKCGDRRSIPLTLEWSASAPHDLILAGCHDGVVALWKFSASSSPNDTRPLLCFSADTVPIRGLKWAPLPSDPESANVIVTGSHKALKFWDIRDPFNPLWKIPYQKVVNSVDWLPDPRCVVVSFDDGEIKIISLSKAACDAPVTGVPYDKKPLYGSYSYKCSSSSIWSVQVSRLTGMVAYCCSDGKVINFQLTTKAVEKDPNRNREPHYLCGSLTKEEDSSLTVLSPLPDIPIPMKRSFTEWGDTPKSSRGVKSRSNQERRAKGHFSKFQTPPDQPPGGSLVVAQKNNNNNDTTSLETQTHNQMSQALVCIKDDDNKLEETNGKEEETEVFPPKIIAMHCVRWNMNKSSQRLACYGGAAGILRCQEII